MATQDMVKQESTPAPQEETRSAGRILIPAVDIFESEETITLVADMPGVDKKGLDINLEKGLLTISGKVDLSPRGKLLLREFSTANYYRQFKLSELINGDKTSAEFNNGVLTLIIPKAEAAKPRKIKIKS